MTYDFKDADELTVAKTAFHQLFAHKVDSPRPTPRASRGPKGIFWPRRGSCLSGGLSTRCLRLPGIRVHNLFWGRKTLWGLRVDCAHQSTLCDSVAHPHKRSECLHLWRSSGQCELGVLRAYSVFGAVKHAGLGTPSTSCVSIRYRRGGPP